jgi:TRAP-type C4-dicarboxylate transport system substrate-binding protein
MNLCSDIPFQEPRALRRFAFRLCVLSVVLWAAPLQAASPAASVTLKMGTLAPEGSSWHLILKDMGEAWRAAPGGGVALKIWPGGVMGDEPVMVQKMRVGQLHAGVLTLGGLTHIDKAGFALCLPMMYRSYAELDYVRGRMQPYLEKRLADKGFVVLNWGDGGWVRFFGKTPIRTPDDLKRMKFFVWAGDNDSVRLWKSAGFSPVALSNADIMSRLQTGSINCFDATALSALSLQWFPFAPKMTDVDWAPLLGATVVTKAAWSKVPAAARSSLRSAAIEAGERMRSEIRSADRKAVDIMKTKGLEVVTVTPEERAMWQTLFENAYPQMVGPLVPKEAFDLAMKYRAEYRANGGK